MHSESDEDYDDMTFEEWAEEYGIAFQFRDWGTVRLLQDEYPLYLERCRDE